MKGVHYLIFCLNFSVYNFYQFFWKRMSFKLYVLPNPNFHDLFYVRFIKLTPSPPPPCYLTNYYLYRLEIWHDFTPCYLHLKNQKDGAKLENIALDVSIFTGSFGNLGNKSNDITKNYLLY